MTRQIRAGINIFERRAGQGARALLSHCSLAHGGVWKTVMDHMADRWAMTAIDLPDHGLSDPTPKGHDPQHLSAAVILDIAAATDGPSHLVGHSFGGTAALLAAVTQPNAFASLTLIEPVPFGIARGTDAFDDHSQALADFPAALNAGDRAKASDIFMSVWGGGVPFDLLPAKQQRYIQDRIHIIAAQGPALYDDINGIMAPGRISAIQCPVVLIQGNQSPDIAAVMLDVLAQHLPQAKRHTIKGAGHMLPITHAKDIAAILRNT